MLKALYYPHTDIQSPTIIKNALLLWDSVETIVPYPNWKRRGPTGDPANRRRRPPAEDKLLREARELIVRPRVPNSSERKAAHASLLPMVESGLVSSLILSGPRQWRGSQYLVYPEKFLDDTWHFLERVGMAHWVRSATDYGVPPALGFLMMSTLADACAGGQIQKVTDRVEAYSWLAQQQAKTLGSPYVTGLDISQAGPSLDRLVTITCEVLDAREVPLKKLVEFRKRELKSRTADYSAMRRQYSALLQEHLSRIGKEAKTENDVRELQNEFKAKITQDLSDLKAELKQASWNTLFSKEVAASAAIMAGCLAFPVVGLTALATHLSGIGIIPLVGGQVKYRAARRKALRAHPISWLYLTKQKALPAY